MNSNEIFKYVNEIFSEHGLSLNGITIKCHPESKLQVNKNDNGLSIRFTNKKPNIVIRKIIRFSLSLSAIHLSENGGVLEIDNFPDIPFKYEEID